MTRTEDDLPGLLRSLASGIEHRRISGPGVIRLGSAVETALSCVRRDSALRRAAELLDPDFQLSKHARAQAVERALERFESTGWIRISKGFREPRGPLEEALVEALECEAGCPRSSRRIFDVL